MNLCCLAVFCIVLGLVSIIGCVVSSIFGHIYFIRYEILLSESTKLHMAFACLFTYFIGVLVFAYIPAKKKCTIYTIILLYLACTIIIMVNGILVIKGDNNPEGFKYYNISFDYDVQNDTFILNFEQSFNCIFSEEYNESTCQVKFDSYFENKVLCIFLPIVIGQFLQIILYFAIFCCIPLMMMKDDQSTEEVSQNDITLTMPILSPRYDEYQRDNGNRANIDYNG